MSKIDIKELFNSVDKKKLIPFSLIVLVIVGLIYYAFSSSETQKSTEKIENPDTEREAYNSKLEAQGDKKESPQISNYSNVENEDEIQDVEKFNPNEILRAINSAENNSENSTVTRDNYNPYGERDMYTIPEAKAPDYSYQEQSQNYTPTHQVKRQEERKNKKNGSGKIKNWRITESNQNKSIEEVYRGAIIGTRNKYLTPENNRVSIRVIEPFSIEGVAIPQSTILVAYASFTNELKLEIKSIVANNKVIPVSISVLDTQGQNAIEIVGGTGAEIGNELENEAISETKTGNNIIDKTISIFTKNKKPKAMISADYVLLKINQ